MAGALPDGDPVPTDGSLPSGAAANAGKNGFAVYVHVPFCASRCGYCDFNTYTASELGGVGREGYADTVLPRLSSRAAAELYLTSEVFDGVRAAEVGLVTKAVPAEGLDATVAAYCDALVQGGPLALAGAKQLLRRAPAPSIRAELAELSERSGAYFRSAEGTEGVNAFREKRPPSWVPAP
jgi:methylglutaconyl-CoA hydratase